MQWEGEECVKRSNAVALTLSAARLAHGLTLLENNLSKAAIIPAKSRVLSVEKLPLKNDLLISSGDPSVAKTG
jgi:hypothetical protein